MFSCPVPDIDKGRLAPSRGWLLCGYASSACAATCRQPASWHVRLAVKDGRAFAILLCAPHMELVRSNNVYIDRHRTTPACDAPGWVWYPGNPSFCAVPGEEVHAVGDVERAVLAGASS